MFLLSACFLRHCVKTQLRLCSSLWHRPQDLERLISGPDEAELADVTEVPCRVMVWETLPPTSHGSVDGMGWSRKEDDILLLQSGYQQRSKDLVTFDYLRRTGRPQVLPAPMVLVTFHLSWSIGRLRIHFLSEVLQVDPVEVGL